MTARVTVSLPDDLLARLDAIAASENVTRSDVVREAAGSYVAAHVSGEEALRQVLSVEDGLVWLEGIAAKPALDTRDTLEILRELRGDDAPMGAPLDEEVGRS